MIRYAFIFFGSCLLALLISDLAVRKDAEKIVAWKNIENNVTRFQGVVQAVEEDGLSLKLQVENVRIQNSENDLPGVLEIKTAASEEVKQGDEIKFIGKIGVPNDYSLGAGHFDPRRYYARYGIYATMVNPRITVLAHGSEEGMEKLRNYLRNRFYVLLPEPDAGLFSATLLGFMHDVPKSLRTDFSNSGLAHLVAISGQHVGMLAVAVFLLTTILGVPRINAMIATTILATVFIVLVDFPPSGIRSVIMITAVYLAYASGRKSQGFRILLMTVVMMLIANPRILLADLGFQLSALAMWSLIVFYPIFQRMLLRKDLFSFQSILLMTFCAMFITTPLIAYSFGRVSMVGLITNVFAAPLYPPLMLLGVAVIFFGSVPYLQSILFLITHVLTNVFIWLVEISAKLPGANIPLNEFPAGFLVSFYIFVFVLSLVFSRQTRKQFWPINELFNPNKFSVRPEHIEKEPRK